MRYGEVELMLRWCGAVRGGVEGEGLSEMGDVGWGG